MPSRTARQADLGLADRDLALVRTAILATAGHQDDNPALAPLLDADLCILGADPARYGRYREAIRAEHAAVPGLLFRLGRRRFLRTMLARRPIYATAAMRARCEVQARINLAEELAGTGRWGSQTCA